MLQELLYLGPEQVWGDYYPQFVYKTNIEQLEQLSDANRAMIVESAWNQTANQKKALKVGIISGHK